MAATLLIIRAIKGLAICPFPIVPRNVFPQITQRATMVAIGVIQMLQNVFKAKAANKNRIVSATVMHLPWRNVTT